MPSSAGLQKSQATSPGMGARDAMASTGSERAEIAMTVLVHVAPIAFVQRMAYLRSRSCSHPVCARGVASVTLGGGTSSGVAGCCPGTVRPSGGAKIAHVSQEVLLAGGIREVFDFVTDPSNFPSYVEGYSSGRAVSERAVGVGATYEWFAPLGPWKLKTTEEVTEWKPPERVQYRGVTLSVPFVSSMELRPVREGVTELRVNIDFTVPAHLGGRATGALLERLGVRPHVRASLAKLQRLLGTG